MKDKIIEIVSWCGAFVAILAYSLVSFGIIQPTLTYQIFNISAAMSIAIVSLHKKVYQPAVLNIISVLIGTIAIVKYYL